MSIEVKRLEARHETIEAILDEKVVVRALCVPKDKYVEAHWLIYIPGAASIIGHEIPVLRYSGEDLNPAIVDGFAELIKAATP